MSIEYLVVGAGLTGSTIARLLVDAGKDVLVVDRRGHLGGNVHDHVHAMSGIVIHTYGPHYFRTSSDKIWNFVNRFSDFYGFEAQILSKIRSNYYHWPVWRSEMQKLCKSSKPFFEGVPTNFEQAALKLMPREIYELFIKEYNEKQWGVPASQLQADLCRRFDVRETDEPRLKPDAKYQGLPTIGYAGLMMRMLDGVKVELGVNYLLHKERIKARHVIYTGPIDEYFNYSLGRLHYRGQRREHIYHQHAERLLPCAQVNYPMHADGKWIRSIEWKHMQQNVATTTGTVITTETPFTPTNVDEFEYPFPDDQNHNLYEQYRNLANTIPNLTIAGRLGDYKYYDMDQAIGKAMKIAECLIG